MGESFFSGSWKDSQALKLIEPLVTGRLTEIKPVIDLKSANGFVYPEADRLLETSGSDTVRTLDSLVESNVLGKCLFEKIHIDPEGSFQLIPVERCPRCDSGNLTKGQLLEHFSCGYSGFAHGFEVDDRYICPKCHKSLKLIDADYRNAGMHSKCLDCNEIVQTPLIKWRSLQTGKIWLSEELRELGIYS